MKKTTLFLILGCIFQLSIAQKQLPAEIKASIQKRIEVGHTPSIVVGIIDKDGTHYYSFGTKSIGGEEVNEHTIYEIGSITKTFTAIMLAQMSLEGKLKTDDPVQNYLPVNVKMPTRDGKQITLGHLSDHSSGLPRMPSNFKPNDAANPYADYTSQQLFDFLNGLTLSRDIGSVFEYSNLAVGLLGHILATKEGTSYENMMINRIAKPLGMNETRVTFNEQMKKNLALPYSNGVQVSNWDIATLTGAGAIRSSAFDMLRYVAANMGIQKSRLLPAMQLSHQARHNKAGTDRVGLGWFISKGAEGDVISHDGGTGGYRTFAGFVKETGRGVVVMTNSDKGVSDIGMRLLDSTAKLITVKKSAIDVIEKAMQSKGIEAGLQAYADLKKQKDEYNLNEDAVNAVGYKFLQSGKVAEAMAIFKINVYEFPKSFNVYDSYAEALMTEGKKDSAIIYYKKSLEINPANTNATDMIAKMTGVAPPKDVTVPESVLANYVGIYELAPGFTITVTHSGKQLFGQATGQQQFEMFATSDTEFYLKVVPAKVVFSVKDGKADSLTLFQGGKEMPGKKIN